MDWSSTCTKCYIHKISHYYRVSHSVARIIRPIMNIKMTIAAGTKTRTEPIIAVT